MRAVTLLACLFALSCGAPGTSSNARADPERESAAPQSHTRTYRNTATRSWDDGQGTPAQARTDLGVLRAKLEVPHAEPRVPVELPPALRGGEADTYVYVGVRNGRWVYVGITNDMMRRQAQHRSRFLLQQITPSPVLRGEARAIEQAMLVRYGSQFENVNNSISPKHPWYDQAVQWGDAWLIVNGFAQ